MKPVMVKSVPAIYENGVLRPLEPVTLSEHQKVRLLINKLPDEGALAAWAGLRVYGSNRSDRRT
jgi:predicted DNA-binding antitoxin AbrB/MazE fold protein